MSTEEKIKDVIEKCVNPVLAAHYGEAAFSAYEDGIVWVKMLGACGNCPSAEDTLQTVIKDAIVQVVPEVKDVKIDRTVGEDLLEMARKILRGEIKD